MSSIIINSFYRALTSIEENEGIKNLSVKQLTTLLVDILYPEDGVLTWENDKTLKIKFNGKVPVEEETHSVEVTIPVAEPAAPEPAVPEPEVKEIKVKEVKPKLTKEQKEAEKAEKAAAAKAEKEAKAAAAKAEKDAKAAEAKAEKEAKAAEAKAAKAAEPKVAKPKFVGNLEKLNATQEKTWKKLAAESKIEITDDHKQRFLAQLNDMDKTEYNSKKLEVWMTEFFTPKEPEVKTAEVEMFAVDYNGKEYGVDKNGDVYETVPGTDVDKKVGKVGMAYFADMEMPTE
jgi:colicin import membrane protein